MVEEAARGQTPRDLVAGSGLSFQDRRVQVLKHPRRVALLCCGALSFTAFPAAALPSFEPRAQS